MSGWTTFMGCLPSSVGAVRNTMSSASPKAAYVVYALPSAPFLVCFFIIVSETNTFGRPTRMWTRNDVRASSTALIALMPLENTLAPIAQCEKSMFGTAGLTSANVGCADFVSRSAITPSTVTGECLSTSKSCVRMWYVPSLRTCAWHWS